MASMLTDLRFGARLLFRAPGFTLVAVASLALGIGANAAIFGAINGLLLKPVAAVAPDRLVAIFTSDFSGPTYGASSYADAVDFARGTPALAGPGGGGGRAAQPHGRPAARARLRRTGQPELLFRARPPACRRPAAARHGRRRRDRALRRRHAPVLAAPLRRRRQRHRARRPDRPRGRHDRGRRARGLRRPDSWPRPRPLPRRANHSGADRRARQPRARAGRATRRRCDAATGAGASSTRSPRACTGPTRASGRTCAARPRRVTVAPRACPAHTARRHRARSRRSC